MAPPAAIGFPVERRGVLLDALREERDLEANNRRGPMKLAFALAERLDAVLIRHGSNVTDVALAEISRDPSDRIEAFAHRLAGKLAACYRDGSLDLAFDPARLLELVASTIPIAFTADPPVFDTYNATGITLKPIDMRARAPLRPERKPRAARGVVVAPAAMRLHALRRHEQRLKKRLSDSGDVDDDALAEVHDAIIAAIADLAAMSGVKRSALRVKPPKEALKPYLDLKPAHLVDEILAACEDSPELGSARVLADPDSAATAFASWLEVLESSDAEAALHRLSRAFEYIQY